MPTIHLVSHTHWDREWYRPFQLFRLQLVRLVDNLLALLADDPDYRHFMLDGQAIVLEDYLAIRPEREADIRRYVQAGRLAIGPWYVLPDEFLVSPEAIVRNLLAGRQVCSRFGASLPIGYLPDTFGHIGQMPQILAGFRLESAVVWRGLDEQPAELWWQAPDGSRVFLIYLRHSYANASKLPMAGFPAPDSAVGDPALRAAFPAEVAAAAGRLAPHAPSGHLLLLLGVDHMEPPPGTSAAIKYAQGKLGAYSLLHSSLPDYLQAAQAALADQGTTLTTVQGELRSSRNHYLLPGVLSTRMWIKQRNWTCQVLLESWAEPFSAYASLLAPLPAAAAGSPGYVSRLDEPAAALREAWRLLLQCQPHDSICGCSVDQVHDEMRPRFDQVEQIAEEITLQSLLALAEQVDTREPRELRELRQDAPAGNTAGKVEAALVVFNATGALRTDTVTVVLPGWLERPLLVDEYGSAAPYDLIAAESRTVVSRFFDRAGFTSFVNSLSANSGQLGGLTVARVTVKSAGHSLHVAVTLSAGPGLPAAELGQALIELAAGLADPGLTTCVVHAVTTDQKLRLVARDLPPHGYRTFWARPALGAGYGAWGAGARPGQEDTAGEPAIENEYLRVEADRALGTFTVTDRRTGHVYPGLNRLVDGGDAGDEYNYWPPDVDPLLSLGAAGDTPAECHVIVGEAASQLALTYTLAVPAVLAEDRRTRSGQAVALRVRTSASLARGVPRVDVLTEIDNTAQDHRLRAHFPVAARVTAADYDGHFEVLRRPLGTPAFDETWVEAPRPEAPQRGWTDVSDGQVGLMIAAAGLPEVEVMPASDPATAGTGPAGSTQAGSASATPGPALRGAEIALTLLRCVGWLSRDDFAGRRGNAGPQLATPGAQMAGTHHFAYSIIPHTGGWDAACEDAYAFGAPLRAVVTGTHTGRLPPARSLLRVEPSAFHISAIKAAEDGAGVIVRGYNLAGAPLQVSLLPRWPYTRAVRTGLDEGELESVAIAPNGSVVLTVGPHAISTVKFM